MKCPVNVKIHPTSLEIRGVQVKSTVTYTHATRTAVMQVWQYQSYKGYEWQQLLKNAGGSVDWNNHFGRKLGNIQGASLVAQTVKNMPAVQETWVWSLGWEDPLEKEMATHSSILPWKIPWTDEPSRLQFMGTQRIWHDLRLNDNLVPHSFPVVEVDSFYSFLASLGLRCCTQQWAGLLFEGLASHCGGFSCCRARAVGCVSFSSCGAQA